MEYDRFHLLSDLFERAIALPADARPAFLDQHCPADPPNGAFRVELERQITKAWQAAGGERAKFQSAIAEHRARILSLATVSASHPQLQKVASDFERELSRYLVERQGASGDGVIV